MERFGKLCFWLLVISIVSASPVIAKIYRYQDEEGIIYFTDAPVIGAKIYEDDFIKQKSI